MPTTSDAIASSPEWLRVAEALEARASSPTSEQVEVAAQLGLPLPLTTPAPVAREKLRAFVARPLELPVRPWRWGNGYVALLNDLEAQLSLELTNEEDSHDAEFLRAWIEVRYAQLAALHLRKLKPERGDVLFVQSPSKSFHGELSSIGSDGQLYFRGGMGRRCRPAQAVVSSRVGSDGYDKALYQVEQEVALIRSDVDNGYARMPELAEWKVADEVTDVALAALRDALDAAVHEDVLQAVIERFPELLGALMLGTHGTFVVPQKNLGGEYVPDFLVGGVTSLGFRWLLVELESPSAPMRIKDGQGSQQLRKGINQIKDWRNWITENLSTARKPRTSHGLGLPGIKPNSDGLVLISRDDHQSRSNAMRNTHDWESHIQVHSYDWLLRTVANRLHNPFHYEFGTMAQETLDAEMRRDLGF